MEGSAKVDLEKTGTPLGLDLGSKPSENIPYVASDVNTGKGTASDNSFHYSSNKSVQGHDGDPASLSTFPENDGKQAIPFTISLSRGVVESKGTLGPDVTAALQLVSVKAAMPENVLCHSLNIAMDGCSSEPATALGPSFRDALPHKDNSCLQDTRILQRVTSAVAHRGDLPLHVSPALDGGSSLQLATSAPLVTVANAMSEAEHRPSVSNERVVFRKDKVKKRPRQLLQDARTHDLNKSGERQPVIRWKDVWVAQLIHIRGRMHSTFTSPQRQKVDLWQVVKHEMTSSCHGFDKDSEACRKKWIRVYKEYKDDRHFSNDEKTQKCRFYDLVDFYMGDRANSFRNMSLRSEVPPLCPDAMHLAKDSMVTPLPTSSDVDVKAVDGKTMAPEASSDTSLSKPTPDLGLKKSPPAKKYRAFEKPLSPEQPLPPPLVPEAPVFMPETSKSNHMKNSVQGMLSELVNIGKEMLQTTRDFEKEKLAVLHSIKDTLGKIAKKI